MDVFCSHNYTDTTTTTHIFGSDTHSSDCVHSPLSFSSTERGGGGGITATFSYSDEEVILASDRPKRRAGRTKFKETRHPVYRGVRKRNNDKWVCELREPNKKTRIWLGTFATPEMAARAHDVAAMALRGRSATLNFADSVWRLPVPASLDPKDIRKAAAEAAKAFDNHHHHQQQQLQQLQQAEVEEVTSKKNQLLEDHSPEKMFYMDEDVEFGMPRLLADMAEGLLLSPPSSFGKGFNWDDQVESNTEVSLWNYSI